MRIQRMSDNAIAAQLGGAIRERRLRKNITQDNLAESVGVSTPTIQKIEKGKGTLLLLIAILRELNSLELLTEAISPPRVSPLEVARTGKTSRRRAAPRPDLGYRSKLGIEQPNGHASEEPMLLIPRKKRV